MSCLLLGQSESVSEEERKQRRLYCKLGESVDACNVQSLSIPILGLVTYRLKFI